MLSFLSNPRNQMDRNKLKVILTDLKRLVSELESEVYSDTDVYLKYDEIAKCTPFVEDDDGYPD